MLHNQQELDLIFSLHAHRKLPKNLTLQYKNREYQLTGQGYIASEVHRGHLPFDGTVALLYKGQALPYILINEGKPPIPLDDEKSIHATRAGSKVIQSSTAEPINLPLIVPRGEVTPKMGHFSLGEKGIF